MKPGTPLPWTVGPVPNFRPGKLTTKIFHSGRLIADTNEYSYAHEDNEQNAAYIVHVANLHNDLVEALEDTLTLLTKERENKAESQDYINESFARTVLVRAKGL